MLSGLVVPHLAMYLCNYAVVDQNLISFTLWQDGWEAREAVRGQHSPIWQCCSTTIPLLIIKSQKNLDNAVLVAVYHFICFWKTTEWDCMRKQGCRIEALLL